MTELNYFFGHLKKIKSMTEKSPKNSNELSAWEHQMQLFSQGTTQPCDIHCLQYYARDKAGSAV